MWRISIERNVTFGGEVLLPPVMLDTALIVGEQDTVKETNQSYEGTAQPVEDLQKLMQPVNDNSKRDIPASMIQSLELRKPRCSERLCLKPETEETDLRRSDRLRQQTAVNLIEFLDDDSALEFTMAASHAPFKDPANIEEARTQSDWPEWEKSIRCELEQHEQIGTWELVDLPSGINIIGNQIVLHYKLDKHSTIHECKLRVIAQGFSQVEGIDYEETFSPTAKLTAIGMIAALAVRSD